MIQRIRTYFTDLQEAGKSFSITVSELTRAVEKLEKLTASIAYLEASQRHHDHKAGITIH